MSLDASLYVRRTPRQRAQAAARYDREARETIAAYNARRTAEARAKHLARALSDIEALGPLLLRGVVRKAGTERPLTREERRCCVEVIRDGWRVIKRNGSPDFVTVLA